MGSFWEVFAFPPVRGRINFRFSCVAFACPLPLLGIPVTVAAIIDRRINFITARITVTAIIVLQINNVVLIF